MNFCLRGHDRENGVRELLICLFPEESHIDRKSTRLNSSH